MQASNFTKRRTDGDSGGDPHTPPPPRPNPKAQRQLLRFFVVGGLNTCFGYSLFAVLTYVGVVYPIAIGLATIGGVLFNFQSIGRMVFGGAPRSRFWRFVGVYCIVYLVNVGSVHLLLRLGANVYVANAIMLIPLSLLAFILNRQFVFDRS
jgi:putative flippase GtrA